jgi:DNA-binding MarR family transcriptional regulator
MPGDAPSHAWYEEVSVPVLLRKARTTYGSAIRRALVDVGCPDVPRNGIYVLAAIARNGSPLSEIIQGLGVSKQAAGQLVDTLVVRGYLERAPDAEDRRRLTLTLTEFGQLAAAASRSAVERVDAELVARVGPEHVRRTRATLAALIDLGDEPGETPGPRSNP